MPVICLLLRRYRTPGHWKTMEVHAMILSPPSQTTHIIWLALTATAHPSCYDIITTLADCPWQTPLWITSQQPTAAARQLELHQQTMLPRPLMLLEWARI